MGLLEEAEQHFETKDLYQVLGVEKDSTEKQLKKAYYLLSLKYHPDRAEDDADKENRTSKFQVLSRVYEVLSDKEKRAVYDETGTLLDEADILTEDKNWEQYWRLLFKKISKKDIEEFEQEYKGSEEEKEAILGFYEQFEGDMDEIMSHVMCATYEDEDRIRDIIKENIDAGNVEEYLAFEENKKKKRKRMREAKREEAEAEQHAKDIGLDASGDLEALILKRNAERGKEFDSLLSNLEAKYAKKPAKKGGAKKAKTKKWEGDAGNWLLYLVLCPK